MFKREFLFKRINYENIPGGAYYEYKGYYIEPEQGSDERSYPIVLYFKSDELVIAYRGKGFIEPVIEPVFSLYVADGDLNQAMLSEKIEFYWKMPFWRPKKVREKKGESKEATFIVDEVSLNLSLFPAFSGFTLEDDHFERFDLFKGQRSEELRVERNKVRFISRYKVGRYAWDERTDEWTLDTRDKGKKIIKSNDINFRRILVDFLFELDHTNTFEDKNFLKLQPALQNNKLLDALSRKISYLYQLQKLRDEEIRHRELPKPFLKAEKSWLNACFLESYKDVFTSPETIFKNGVEKEVKDVVFNAYIGKMRHLRRKYLRKEDSNIVNYTVSFLLRRYAIYDAFRLLLPQWFHPLLIFPILLLIPFGDYLPYIHSAGTTGGGGKPTFVSYGLFSVILPMVLLFLGLFYYYFNRINLFKLVLPRMFLGIAIGWFAFATGEELWKKALLTPGSMLLLVDVIFAMIILIYLFTEIRNKLVRVKDRDVLKRTVSIAALAMVISLIQGFYIIQLFAKPILENSGIIDTIVKESGVVKKETGKGKKERDKVEVERHYSIEWLGRVEEPGNSKTGKIPPSKKNTYTYAEKFRDSFNRYLRYLSLKLFGQEKWRIRYLWSILLSQFILAIFIGIVLQFLWEDRPITEPL